MCTENYDACYPDQPVVDRYLPVWAKLPAFAAKPAFVWADDDAASTRTALTYAQLDATAACMARNLLAGTGTGSLRRGDAVLVLASPGLRLVKLLFACQRAGLTAVPVVPPDDPATLSGPAHAHLLRAVSQARPAAAVADAGYIDAVAKAVASSVAGGENARLAAMLGSLRWLAVDELEREPERVCDGPQTPYVGCGPDDVYLIQYTSGATGVPRPVVVTAGSAAHNVRAARKAYDLQPGSVVVSWLPQYHDCGLMFLLLTVVAGATCVLSAPGAFVRRPDLWLELVSEFGATCTPVPSFALPLVLRRGRGHRRQWRRPLQLGSLRNLILINEPIYESRVGEFVEAFRCHGLRAASVSPSYGLAENCTFVSTAWRPSACSESDRLPSYMKLLPSARLSPAAANEVPAEIEIAVVDEGTGEPVEDGVEGEIWVSSPSNASGYLGHPSASREVFCARVPGRTGACFVRTGDRGVVRGAERYLYVVGRSADVLALDAGRRHVHTHYVETAAFGSASGRLRGGCVAAFATSSSTPWSRSQIGVVAVVAELQKGSAGVGDHRGLCDGIRAAVWREEGVRVGLVALVDGGVVPKTTSGKLRRGAAREMLAAGKLSLVFETRYDDCDGSVAGVRGEEEETAAKSGASWLEGEGGETGMATEAFGSASRRLRLQSFL
jgi:acyl-CoA synthetase (AMP-forming)/AMP-acid ligase II